MRSLRRNGRKQHGKSSSREHHDHKRRQSCNTRSQAFARAAEPGTRHEFQDGDKVTEAGDSRGHEDRPHRIAGHRADGGRGSVGRCLPGHSLLPPDDRFHALQFSISQLTRSALHQYFQRHAISRLPDVEGNKSKRLEFKRYLIGLFHIDIAEVQTVEDRLYLFFGIDRTSKFAVTQLVGKACSRSAGELP